MSGIKSVVDKYNPTENWDKNGQNIENKMFHAVSEIKE